MALFDGLYATDEDVAAFAPGDAAMLFPTFQRIAEAQDGELLDDRWTLRSADQPPATCGVEAGCVVTLNSGSSFKDDVLGVAATSGADVVLRRLAGGVGGMPAGIGGPPGPVGGCSGVRFWCRTAWPQLNQATLNLNQRYQIIGPTDLVNPDDFKRACVLSAVIDLYISQAHQAGMPTDDYMAKAKMYSGQLKAFLIDVLDANYGPAPESQRAVVRPMTPLDIRYPDGSGGVFRPPSISPLLSPSGIPLSPAGRPYATPYDPDYLP